MAQKLKWYRRFFVFVKTRIAFMKAPVVLLQYSYRGIKVLTVSKRSFFRGLEWEKTYEVVDELDAENRSPKEAAFPELRIRVISSTELPHK